MISFDLVCQCLSHMFLLWLLIHFQPMLSCLSKVCLQWTPIVTLSLECIRPSLKNTIPCFDASKNKWHSLLECSKLSHHIQRTCSLHVCPTFGPNSYFIESPNVCTFFSSLAILIFKSCMPLTNSSILISSIFQEMLKVCFLQEWFIGNITSPTIFSYYLCFFVSSDMAPTIFF